MPDTGPTYTLPASYFVQNGDTLLPVQHNPVFEDVADALTNRVTRDGSGNMTGPLDMAGYRVLGVGAAESPSDAVNLSGMQGYVQGFGMGTAQGAPLLANFKDASVPLGFYRWDDSTASPPQETGGGGAIKFDRGGGRSAWLAARMAASSTTPQFFLLSTNGSNPGAWGEWVEIFHAGNLRSDAQNDALYTPQARTISAGDGLSGGGTLGLDRSLAVDSSVVRTSRTLSAGSGLTGGGALSANRSFALDGNDNRNVDHSSVSITAGNGLTGGGNLTASRSLAVGAGSGISVSGSAVAVDSTVVRTSGNQSISGTKNFTGNLQSNGQAVLTSVDAADVIPSARGAVGSYALCFMAPGGSTIDGNATTPGSNLVYGKTNGAGSTSPSGTWRNMSDSGVNAVNGGLFLRIS